MKKQTSFILACTTILPLATFACGGEEEPPPPPAVVCDRTVAGNICTVAGNGENAYLGDDGPALEASMSLPQEVLAAPSGDLYILDWNNHRLRMTTADGVMRHVAGRGELGGTLDDPANNDFNHPTSMIFGADGNSILIAAWHNSMVRTLDLASGEVTDVCGDGRRAYFGDDGPAIAASMDLPASLIYSPDGDLVIMDQANQVLRYIDQDGLIHRLAGQCIIEPEGGCGGAELFACPNLSGKMTCDLSLCADPCTPAFAGEGEPADTLRMSQPFGQSADPAGRLAYDAQGNLYFADSNNHVIRMIGTDGMVSTVAGTPPVGGVPQYGYEGDGGPATQAKLDNPVDLAFGPDGTLYFTDVYNHCVRGIFPDGIIDTVAGVCGQPGYEGDNGPAEAALLKRPYGLELSGDTLYIADTGNNVIRAILLQ